MAVLLSRFRRQLDLLGAWNAESLAHLHLDESHKVISDSFEVHREYLLQTYLPPPPRVAVEPPSVQRNRRRLLDHAVRHEGRHAGVFTNLILLHESEVMTSPNRQGEKMSSPS